MYKEIPVILDTNSFIDQDPSFLRGLREEGDAAQRQSAEQVKFNAFRQETQDVTLTTEEGDIVTISSLTQFQASYMSFDYSAQLKEKNLSMEAEQFKVATKNAFEISVEGDLNEEEKEDIAQVLEKLDGIMSDLVSGDIDNLVEEAVSLIDDTDTISGLEAVLEFHQRVSLEQRMVTQTAGRGMKPPHPEHPAHPPHPPQGAKGMQSLYETASGIIAKITGQMMEILEQSSTEPGKLENPLKKLFDGFKHKLGLEGEEPGLAFKSGLADQLFENLNESFFV
jgi:hypothetical protein